MGIEAIPESLGLIPDGNRRWARSHKISFLSGYRYGVKKFVDFSNWCVEYGIKNLSVWALSTENINRPKHELNALFNIYRAAAKDKNLIRDLHSNETKFKIVGDERLLPRDLLRLLKGIEAETASYSKRTLNLLIGYGGKSDILHAVNTAVAKARNGGLKAVTERIFSSYLFSAGIGNLDLIIRTSGEMRLSGFMPWQSGYAELYFSKKLWPDFSRRDLGMALREYSRRERRFGR
ncbi:MAG: polyprenyl diphosphate synthase [Candidatus Micrarchaeaceae archaeon]